MQGGNFHMVEVNYISKVGKYLLDCVSYCSYDISVMSMNKIFLAQ